jgi:hypothetical protein
MNKTLDQLIALLMVLALHLIFSLEVEADNSSHTTRTAILSNTTTTVSNVGILTLTSVSQLEESLSTVIARVHSVEPFTIEVLDDLKQKDEILYYPRPFIKPSKYSADDLKGLQSGDVILADTYSHLYDASELALGTGIKNIKKLNRRARVRYAMKGILLYYAPVRNSPNSYLTIYRDGIVLCHGMPGNEMANKHLTEAKLNRLKSAYFAGQINHISSDTSITEYGPGLFLLIDRNQRLDVKNPSARLQGFLARLDSMIESYIQSATYRIRYIKRVAIKDWVYAEILPLDLAGGENGDVYLNQNIERLSRIKASPAFFKEAEDYDRGEGNFYRYKGKLYSFTFGACTDKPTGSWSCVRVAELPYGRLRDNYWGYTEWPNHLGVRLSAVPQQGLDIPKTEYYKHREFYTSLLWGSRFRYREGDCLFLGVQVNYR